MPSFDPSSHPLASNKNVLSSFPYQCFSPALALRPMSPSPLASWDFFSEISLPERQNCFMEQQLLEASHLLLHPQELLPTALPQIQFSIYICFLATGAILFKIKNLGSKQCCLNRRLKARVTATMFGEVISKVKRNRPESSCLLCVINIELQGDET